MADLLGEIVTWDTAGARPVSVGAVRSSLASAGLPEDEAGDLAPRSIFSRACKDLKKNRLIRKVEQAGSVVTFQLTTEELVSAKLEYAYECRISLDTETGVISCPEDQSLEAHTRSLFAAASVERTSRDVTAIVQRLFTKHAELYPVNPRKGVAYFVPDKHSVFSAKVETFLRSMGGVLWRFPVPKGTTQGDMAVQDALKHGFEERLAELHEAIAGWDEHTRQGTMDKLSLKLDIAKLKIDAYKDLLKDQMDALNALVEDGKKKVSEKLSAAGQAV